MRVLIGVDGSEGGWEGIYQASKLLSGDRDQIALYYSPPQIVFKRGVSPSDDMIERTRTSLADNVLDEALQRLPAAWHKQVEKIIGQQKPREGIPAAAESWKADLVVVGARGSSTQSRTAMGSVARAIVRSTSVPVMVARKKLAKQTDGGYRVLMGLDVIPQSKAPAEFLARCSWPQQASGRLLHVIEPMLGAELPEWLEVKARQSRDEALSQAWIAEYQAEKRQKYDELAEYAKQLPAIFHQQSPIVLEGFAAEKILETIQADDIDLLIVGTRDLGAWQRFMLGSTAEKVVQQATCSVLVLHHFAAE